MEATALQTLCSPGTCREKLAGFLSMTMKCKGRMPQFIISNIRRIIVCGGPSLLTAFLIKSNHTAVKIPCDLLQFVNGTVDDQAAVCGQELCKLMERISDIVNILEKVQMILLNI